MVEYWLQPGYEFRLRPSTLLTLHRIAPEGLSAYAGNFRLAGIEIGGSKHVPEPAFKVPELVKEMCDYVNGNWTSRSAVHLAGYVLWRLNWIHPFTDGNGRTARAVSYLVLCAKAGVRLPGTNTVPEQIANDRTPYYRALEMADAASQGSKPDVTELENLLDGMLAKQLLAVHQTATRRDG